MRKIAGVILAVLALVNVNSYSQKVNANSAAVPEGTEIQLKFSDAISSKTAAEGDQVVFEVGDNVKIGNTVVIKAGTKAVGEVTNAKKAGMMGRPGELNIRLNYVKVGDKKISLRGTRAKSGDDATTGTIALTVLFGPIGLIKHGKDIEIKQGMSLKAYTAEDVVLPIIAAAQN